MHLLISLLVSFIGVFAQGESTASCESLLQLQPLEAAQVRPLLFKNTEVFRRNNDIGLQQKGDIEFVKWIEVGRSSGPEVNFVGLTREGRLLHLVQWKESDGKERKIARLLAGRLKLKDIYIFENEVLVGVNESNSVFLYSPALWSKSPVGKMLKRGLAQWSLSSLAILTYTGYFHPELMPLTQNPWDYVLPGGLALTSAMTAAFAQLQTYDSLNTYPNGMVPTAIRFEAPEELHGKLRSLSDVELKTLAARLELSHPVQDQLYPPIPDAATEEIR